MQYGVGTPEVSSMASILFGYINKLRPQLESRRGWNSDWTEETALIGVASSRGSDKLALNTGPRTLSIVLPALVRPNLETIRQVARPYLTRNNSRDTNCLCAERGEQHLQGN